jgi:hypothetical protein
MHSYSSISGQILVGLVWSHQRSVSVFFIHHNKPPFSGWRWVIHLFSGRKGWDTLSSFSRCAEVVLSISSIPSLNLLLYSSNEKCSTDICIMCFLFPMASGHGAHIQPPLRAICSKAEGAYLYSLVPGSVSWEVSMLCWCLSTYMLYQLKTDVTTQKIKQRNKLILFRIK